MLRTAFSSAGVPVKRLGNTKLAFPLTRCHSSIGSAPHGQECSTTWWVIGGVAAATVAGVASGQSQAAQAQTDATLGGLAVATAAGAASGQPQAAPVSPVASLSLPMLDPASEVLGNYTEIVAGLQEKLRHAQKKQWQSWRQWVSSAPLKVLVVGHGGRDALGALAVVEAAASHSKLRGRVQVHVCTSSWADDEWEAVLERYLNHVEKKGVIDKDAVRVHSFKFHREHASVCATLREHVQGKNVVVQCEQGVDFFVEPLTGQYLQDNYEDNFVHDVCMSSAQAAGIPVFLLQTNSDLDLSRGIQKDDIDANLFHGRLQTNAFGHKIGFQEGHQVEKKPGSLIDLACTVGLAKDKKQAFKDFLGLDQLDDMAADPTDSWHKQKQPRVPNLYSDFISYGAATMKSAQLPVAGVMEVIASLQRQDHKMPWHAEQSDAFLPQPQWLLARLLQPDEVPNGHLRVLTEFREARLHEAQTLVDYLCSWMLCRRARYDEAQYPSGRFETSARGQLLLARQVAHDVKVCCPQIDILGSNAAILRQALNAANKSLAMSEGTSAWCAKCDRIGKSREPDFEFMPVSLYTKGCSLTFFDFTCRLLNSAGGVDAEFEAIWAKLPVRGKDKNDASDMNSTGKLAQSMADVLKKELINACQNPVHVRE